MRSRLVGGGAVLLTVLLVAAGCSDSKMARVTGKVVVDGEPAGGKGAYISFIPADGNGPTTGGAIKDGQYDLLAPVGVDKVQIRFSKVVGKKKLYPTPESPEQDVYQDVVPRKYNEDTELTYEVRPGRNQKDWDLKTQ
jgi:hypothetical protein